MYETCRKVYFKSVLAPLIDKFFTEKRALGYRYETEAYRLREFDRFLCRLGHKESALSREVVKQWMQKRPDESTGNHHDRVCSIRQFCTFLHRQGFKAHIPEPRFTPIKRSNFTPRIFTHDEIRRILEAADSLKPHGCSRLRHVHMPLIFRLLYGSGLRVGELLSLRLKDVDVKNGVLTIRQGKFRKDRLVPIAPSLTDKLRLYATAYLSSAKPESFFFPAPDGGFYGRKTVWVTFIKLLRKCSIPYIGKRKGPRVHDIRHTFAVHRLNMWYRQGADMSAVLPLLSVYLGHEKMAGTQKYLRLIPDIFPDLTARFEACFGHVIPQKERP